LKETPGLNGQYADGIFTSSEAVHMGIATALRGGGLVAPAIRDVDSRDLDEVRVALGDLVPRARAGRLRSSEITGGTVTLSNLGEGSADTVLPLIYPPQVAIIGCGAAAPRPWAVGDAIAVRRVMTLTVAGDHRVSDRRQASRLLIRLAELLERPELL
jgi:pyruvate dehydrogenase E2 component (dihydrolipoamide acetyltransferase)